MKRMISLGWAAYGKLKNTLESELPICLKRKIATYGSETWNPTKSHEESLVALRSMKRKFLKIS